jgi:hypothetical protein
MPQIIIQYHREIDELVTKKAKDNNMSKADFVVSCIEKGVK